MAILKDLTVLGSVRFLQDLWGTVFHGNVDGTASTATNLAGGAAGSIPYQSAAGSTSFLSKGSNGQVLYIESNTIKWKNAGDTHTHSYLPLSGGTLTGSVTATSFIKSGSSNSYILLGGGGQKALSDLVDTSSAQTITGIKRFNSQINSNGCIHQYGGMKVKGRTVHYGTFQVGWDPDNSDDQAIATKFGKSAKQGVVQKGAVESIFYGTVTAHNNVTIDKHLSVGGELEVDSRAKFYSTVDHLGNDVTGIQSLDVNGTVRFSEIRFLPYSSSEGRDPTLQFMNSDGGCIRNVKKIYANWISTCGGVRDDNSFISISYQRIKPQRGGDEYAESFYIGTDSNPWNKLFVYQARVKTLLLGNRALGVVDGFKTTTTSEAVILTKLYWNNIANYWPVVHIKGSAVISSVPKEIDLRLMFNQFSSWRVESSGSFNPKVFIFKDGSFIKIGLKGFTASQIQLSVDVEEDSHGVIGIANHFSSGNSSNSDLPIFADRKMKLSGWDILYYNSATIPSANGSTCYEVQYGDGTLIALTTSDIDTICIT